MKIKGEYFNVWHRLISINIGGTEELSRILMVDRVKVTKMLKNPTTMSLQHILRLCGLLNIDLYTAIGLIIENNSFIEARKNELSKYYGIIEEKAEKMKQNVISFDLENSPYMLLDITKKEFSIKDKSNFIKGRS